MKKHAAKARLGSCLLILLTSLFCCTAVFADSVIVAMPAYNPPFEAQADKDHFYGFDMELMTEICKRIQIQCKFSPFLFKDFFTELKNKDIDLAIGSIIITPEREKEFLFSLPYLQSFAHFVARNDKSINQISDLHGKKIGTIVDSIFQTEVEKRYGTNFQFVNYPDIPSMFQGLANKEVSAVIFNDWSVHYWVAENSNLYKLVGEQFPVGMGFGIVTLPKNVDLMLKINTALLQMQADGTYLKIYSLYFDRSNW